MTTDDTRREGWTVPMSQAEIDDLEGVYFYDDGYAAADDVQRLLATLDAERALHAALVEAARRWWHGKRPVDWSEELHRQRAAVNCTGPNEADLALAIAALDGEPT